MAENNGLGVNVNQEQLVFAKWIVGLSIAILYFSLTFLWNLLPNFQCIGLFIASLVLLALSIIVGVCYVYSYLAGFGYIYIYDTYYKRDYLENPHLSSEEQKKMKNKYEKSRSKYRFLKNKFAYTLSRFCYNTLFVSFLLGLTLIGVFVVSNFVLSVLQK